jgi:glycosyltransferase involved in cell wall biosynthesis
VRILLVSQYFHPEPFRVNDLVQAWSERGHRVEVLTGLPNYPAGRLYPGYSLRGPYRERLAGAEVRRVPLVTRGRRRGLRLALNYLSFAAAGWLAGPRVIARGAEVIVVFAPSPITACLPALRLKRLRDLPVAIWVQDLWPESLAATGAVRSPRLLRIAAKVVRGIYRRCDLVLVQSESFVDAVRAVCPEARRVRVLPNWAEPFYGPLEVEAGAPERRELPDGFTILFAGNLGSSQALETVIAAADLLRGRPIHWVFVGDGNRRRWLESECRRLGLEGRVRFLGQRPPERMPRYLALADVLLVSLRRDPTFAATVPTKVQSYLAAGKPILAALEGEGARAVESSGAGRVVPPEDPAALARAARELHEIGGEALAGMGERARDHARRHFDRERLVARLDGWLEELVEERRCAS